MRATRPIFLRLTLLLLLLVCSASMLVYWNRLPRALHAANIRTGLPNAKPLTDLYPRWYGTREFLLHHRDPYGVEVSREIQIAYYGRALDPSVAGDRLDQERFAYPLYVIFLMLPTVPMEFDTVRVAAWWFLAAVTAAGLWSWLRFLRIQLSVIAAVAIFTLALSSLPVLQGLSLLQLGLLVAGLIAGAAACAANGRFFLAGTLLAIATIKPQMAVLPIAWFAMWTLGAWRQRKSLLWGFGATLTILHRRLRVPASGLVDTIPESSGGVFGLHERNRFPGQGAAFGCVVGGLSCCGVGRGIVLLEGSAGGCGFRLVRNRSGSCSDTYRHHCSHRECVVQSRPALSRRSVRDSPLARACAGKPPQPFCSLRYSLLWLCSRTCEMAGT